MVNPTLLRPDVILEKYASEEGAERDTKYLFIKSFLDDNKQKVYHYEHMIVSKDGE